VTVGVLCANETVLLMPGTAHVLTCKTSIRDSSINPTWWGPPNNTKYNTNSRSFNPNLGEKLKRIAWTNNTIELKLESVTINDTGLYKCEVIVPQKTHLYEIEVNVKGKFKYLSKLIRRQSNSSVN